MGRLRNPYGSRRRDPEDSLNGPSSHSHQDQRCGMSLCHCCNHRGPSMNDAGGYSFSRPFSFLGCVRFVRHHRTLTALRKRTCSSLCKRLETAAAWFLFCNSQLQPLLPLEHKGFAAFRVIYEGPALSFLISIDSVDIIVIRSRPS